MGKGGALRAPGKDEAAPAPAQGVNGVDGVLDAEYVVGGYGMAGRGRGGRTRRGCRGVRGGAEGERSGFGGEGSGELATGNEEGVLDGEKRLGVFGVGEVGDDEADKAVEFVDCAVGFEARVELGDAPATDEGGGAVVATAGIDVGFFHVTNLLYNVVG